MKNVQEVRFAIHTHNLNDCCNDVNWSSIHWRIIIFVHNPTALWCTCLIFTQFLQLSQIEAPYNSTADKPICHLRHCVVVLTHCDHTVDSHWNYAVYNLHRQANLNCTLCTRLHVSLKSLAAADDTQYVSQLYTPSICPPS
jgi:hypothetical protein